VSDTPTRRGYLAGVCLATVGLAGCSESVQDEPANADTSSTTNSATVETRTAETTETQSATTTEENPIGEAFRVADGVPMFQYDAANTGASANRGPAAAPNEQWSKGFAAGRTSPVVSGEQVFVAGGRTLRLVNASDGEIVWEKPGGKGTPALTGEYVFSPFRNGVVAYRRADGTELWKTSLEASEYEDMAMSLRSVSVESGILYAPTTDGSAIAINAETGNVRWRTFLDDGRIEAPVGVSENGVYVHTWNTVFGLDVETGEKQWSINPGSNVGGSSASVTPDTRSAPTCQDGLVYVGGKDGVLYAIRSEDGTVEWSHEIGYPIFSSPSIHEGVVYFGARDSALHALDSKTGEPVWETEVDWIIDSHPTVVDGTVYVATNDSTLYAVDGASGDVQWTYTFDDTWSFTAPAVADGTVYFTTSHGNVTAIE